MLITYTDGITIVCRATCMVKMRHKLMSTRLFTVCAPHFLLLTVPVSPPNPHQTGYSLEMLIRIVHDCGAAFVLTSKEFVNHESIIELIRTSPVPWHCEVATETLSEEESNEDEIKKKLDKAKPEDIPFLQYTSGSTGTSSSMPIFIADTTQFCTKYSGVRNTILISNELYWFLVPRT